MADQNDNNLTDLEKHLAAAASRGKKRFQRRQSKLTLDQTRAGLEVISMNIEDVEQELKNQLQMRKDSKGGRKAFWENWLYFCDLNWNHELDTSWDGKGKPIYNDPMDTNLWNVADRALRVAAEGFSRGHTLVRISKRLGEAFYAHTFGMTLQRSSAGKRLKKQITDITMTDARSVQSREERALFIAEKRGHTPEAWGENQIIQCGNILWNAVSVGGGIFMHKTLPVKKDFDFQSWSNSEFKNKEAYYPILRPEVEQRIADRNAVLETMTPLLGPMPEPPLPWAGDNTGPYKDTELYQMVKLVRNMGEDQSVAVKQAKRDGLMSMPVEAVDVLSSVPYEINRYVFDAFRWVKEDEKLAATVNDFPHIEWMPVKKVSQAELDAMSRRDRADVKREIKQIENDNAERLANLERLKQWEESALLQLEENARGMFWMPHNFDSRGRVYHVGDFGHHNTDCVRAMFRFARKKPIGVSGINYLYRQLAGSYGVDKVSYEKRESWAKANFEMIDACGRAFNDNDTQIAYWMLDEDNNIVEGGETTPLDFWRSADKPFQFLAAANEISELASFCERNPGRGHEFVSGLPISADATNSGMQHYAAASLDYDDGKLTNLVPQDELNDLYMACLARAKVLMAEKLEADKAEYEADPITSDEQTEIDAFEAFQDDESNSYEELQANRDEFKETDAGKKMKLQRQIDAVTRILGWDGYGRKVMKRNAMTFPYSSRRHGFAKQIFKDTMLPLSRKVRKGELDEHPFGKDQGFLAANIMAGIHEQAIKDTVQSAKDGMEFLQSCAAALTNENKHFQFVSKGGFPMHQNYQHHHHRNNRPQTWLYNFEAMDYDRENDSLGLRKFNGQVEGRDSKQGISPNVIHTQDALMLQMTVLSCKQNAIDDLMVVHDSFATVAADAKLMNGCIRLAMANLYDDYDLWADIRDQTIARLDQQASIDMIKDIPDRSVGKLNVADILKAKHAFG